MYLRRLLLFVLVASGILGASHEYHKKGMSMRVSFEIKAATAPASAQWKVNSAEIRPLNYSKDAFCRNGRLSPSVFVIGVQKCGTTTLQGILDLFPTIHAGVTKEHHMFDHPPTPSRHDNSYSKEFPLCKRYKRTLDNTPNYTNPESSSSARIKEYAIRNNMPLDQILFIAMVRPNHKRLKSAFTHEFSINDNFPPAWRKFNYSDWVRHHLHIETNKTDRMQVKSRGYYGKIFKSYFKEFPQSTFLFIESTKAFSSQQPIADALSKLLGLPKVTIKNLVWENSAGEKKKKRKPEASLEEDTRMVKEYFRPHELEFQKLLYDNNNRVHTIPQHNFFESWEL